MCRKSRHVLQTQLQFVDKHCGPVLQQINTSEGKTYKRLDRWFEKTVAWKECPPSRTVASALMYLSTMMTYLSLVSTPLNLTADQPHFPCESEPGLELFRILSGPHIPLGLKKEIGGYMAKWRFWKTNELAKGAEKLRKRPRAKWYQTPLVIDGLSASPVMHHKDILVEMACMVQTANVCLTNLSAFMMHVS